MWRSEADLWELVLSFHLGPREQTLRLFGFSLPNPYSVVVVWHNGSHHATQAGL